MEKETHIQKTFKLIGILLSIAFMTTLCVYWGLNLFFHIQVYYLGIANLALLFPFLLSIAYVMVVSAKRTLDKGIERKQELLAETRADEKENDKQSERKISQYRL
jgi:hypothetical protein